jgi:hypothetical protein
MLSKKGDYFDSIDPTQALAAPYASSVIGGNVFRNW